MENKKLHLFEDKIGLNWVTWLAETRESRLKNALVIASNSDLSVARWEFLKEMERAINEGTITIFSGSVKLIDPANN